MKKYLKFDKPVEDSQLWYANLGGTGAVIYFEDMKLTTDGWKVREPSGYTNFIQCRHVTECVLIPMEEYKRLRQLRGVE